MDFGSAAAPPGPQKAKLQKAMLQNEGEKG
jgi:hypothetical protein